MGVSPLPRADSNSAVGCFCRVRNSSEFQKGHEFRIILMNPHEFARFFFFQNDQKNYQKKKKSNRSVKRLNGEGESGGWRKIHNECWPSRAKGDSLRSYGTLPNDWAILYGRFFSFLLPGLFLWVRIWRLTIEMSDVKEVDRLKAYKFFLLRMLFDLD